MILTHFGSYIHPQFPCINSNALCKMMRQFEPDKSDNYSTFHLVIWHLQMIHNWLTHILCLIMGHVIIISSRHNFRPLQIHTFCFFSKTESNPRSERGKRRADIVITSDTIHRLLCDTEMYVF